ncbi:uncharacterized protein PG998_009399 [Apiospora kogelbergensis]|uniref:uncharacterized protein n=1 Tax=Apiospora kogelbergensis TaxID=1337665 RepID=UPI00312CE1B9
MDEILEQAFDGLRLANGHVDHHARKANLSHFLTGGSLSTNELRLAKDLLSRCTFQVDILSRLPVELAVSVLAHLDIHDIASCLAVSKVWRSVLMSEDVSRALADVHFPALFYTSCKDLASRGSGSCAENVFPLFMQALRTSLRCNDTPFPSEMVKKFAWSDEERFVIDPEEYNHYSASPDYYQIPRRSLYAHGRIAWVNDEHTFVVDCLVTLKRRIFGLPEGKLLGSSLQLDALGSKLLVARLLRYLYAWDIETGRRERVTLPNHMQCCATEGDRVVLVTRDSQVFVWKFGASLLSVDVASVSPPLSKGEIRPVVVAHPNDEDTVFLAIQRLSVHGSPTGFAVYEFNQRQFVGSYEGQLPAVNSNHQSATSSSGVWAAHKWANFEKTSSYGLYAMFYSEKRRPDRSTMCICATQFDIYHKEFVEQWFDIPFHSAVTGYCAWNKCLLYGSSCLQDEESLILVHHSGSGPSARKKIGWPRTGSNAYSDSYMRILSSITHDDRFLVALFLGGYMVWRLDSKPPSPTTTAAVV